MSLNPRSFASIREAMASGEYRSRGQLLRAVADTFRKPAMDRKRGVTAVATEEPKVEEPKSTKKKAVKS